MTDPGHEERPGTVFIACAALGKEVRDIVRQNGWDVDVRVINAKLHLYPSEIGPAVEEKLDEAGDDYGRKVVVYGHCGAMDLDGILADRGAVRPVGPHCYEMFGGETFAEAMKEEPGTFFLTDFLVKAWDSLAVKGLKMDEHPKLKKLLFANYKRVIHFSQVEDPDLVQRARDIAKDIGLPFEHRHTGYGHLEERLKAIMAGEDQPTSGMTSDGYTMYPTAG